MRMVCVCMFLLCQGAWAVNYDGNNLLLILGQSTSSSNYKEFKTFWSLDKGGQNPGEGIKVYINPISEKVESIIITGDNTDLGGLKFKKCNAHLPRSLTLNDDTTTLVKKLGRAEKLMGRNTLLFFNHNVDIEASFTDFKEGKITFFKFSIDVAHHPTTVAAAPPKGENVSDRHQQPDKASATSTSAQQKPKDAIQVTPFKRAILDVFKASKESSFDN